MCAESVGLGVLKRYRASARTTCSMNALPNVTAGIRFFGKFVLPSMMLLELTLCDFGESRLEAKSRFLQAVEPGFAFGLSRFRMECETVLDPSGEWFRTSEFAYLSGDGAECLRGDDVHARPVRWTRRNGNTLDLDRQGCHNCNERRIGNPCSARVSPENNELPSKNGPITKRWTQIAFAAVFNV